jgi:hypothetical protein
MKIFLFGVKKIQIWMRKGLNENFRKLN